MKEYELLRQEILNNIQDIVQYNTLLYTVTVAVLAFAFEKESPFLCLLPYVAIIPIYLCVEGYLVANSRIASYMIVFLEGTDHNWETRLYKESLLDKRQQDPNMAQRISMLGIPERMPHFFVAFICSACTIYKVIIKSTTAFEKWASIIFVFFITSMTAIMMVQKSKRNVEVKRSYMKRWQAVKAEEEAQKRKNNRNPQ